MSSKHYFPSSAANTLVPRYLNALVTANPHLTLDSSNRVVSNKYHDPSHVSIIGGGGSGHEPAWSGYVGSGLLSAAACGDIFASPSTKQVMAAMRAAPSDEGVILLVTNYTGDRLHFGLAAEKAKAEGLGRNVVILPATDDVSLGRTKSARLGRRGLAGHVITMKILCGAAEEGLGFDQCLEIGRAINDQVVTIGSSLDHCHVPGRDGHEPLSNDVCVVGAGIHNEPGAQQISPFPPVEELVGHCLRLLCDPSDPERGFVRFRAGDRVVLLVNNTGGLSSLELGALVDEISTQLNSIWAITPARVFTGVFETSLNAPGFSISLCNVSEAAEKANCPVLELLRLLDLPTSAVSWPNRPQPRASSSTNGMTRADKVSKHVNGHVTSTVNGLKPLPKTKESPDITIDPALLKLAVCAACEAGIAAEPQLTKWDLIMGDGDCGEGIKSVCEDIIANLESADAPRTGSIFGLLSSVTSAVEDMGGTLGAIFGILLAALSSELRTETQNAGGYGATGLSASRRIATALQKAVEALKSHTSAREGDRTVMDVLVPFAEDFAETANFGAAVKVAKRKAEATRYLRPRFGRATYIAASQEQEVPDPGAWALYEMLRGLAKGLDISTN